MISHGVGVEANLPESKRRILRQVRGSDPILAGRKLLIVDDDARNLFALAGLLEHQQMQVLVAENGKEAIAVLDQDPGADLVLMDIMMPEMDGYEAMRGIRRMERFQRGCRSSLTAKAMKGDRENCIEALHRITSPSLSTPAITRCSASGCTLAERIKAARRLVSQPWPRDFAPGCAT
jgi:CheY-like chemotaxis protein